MTETPDEDPDAWIGRALRSLHQEPGYDHDAAVAEYWEGVRRMKTDPEYAAHIEQLAREFDEDCRALGLKERDERPAAG